MDTVLFHQLKEILRDGKADLALSLYAAANGVGAGIKHTVLTGHAILKQQVYNVVLFVEKNVLGFAGVQSLHNHTLLVLIEQMAIFDDL